MTGNTLPGKVCSKCGEPLHLIPMDIGYAEWICLNCDNQRGCE